MKRRPRNYKENNRSSGNGYYRYATDSDGSDTKTNCGGRPSDEKINGDNNTLSMDVSTSADLFLNQTSYVSYGSRQLRRDNCIKPRRFPPKKNPSSGGGGASKTKKRRGKNKSKDDGVDYLSSLIASELTKLSLKDREKALEEVHGVISPNEDEDPERVSQLLSDVQMELKRIRLKQAYEKAAFLSNSYVTDPEFVLMFLRADNYEAKLAAFRLTEHFKYKSELFGEDALVRDIMYDDLTDADKSILHSGLLLPTPLSDRAGRQIIICNICEFKANWSLHNMSRAIWYISVRNTQMNAESGKDGMVGLYFTHGMGNIIEIFGRKALTGTGFLGRSLPYNYSGVHFCHADPETTSFVMGIQTTLMMSLGKHARIRLRSHCGSRLECAYALKSFGIDIDSLVDPANLSESLKGMIKRCLMMDKALKKKQDERLIPHSKDILLGRGRPYQLYPGNLALGDMINLNKAQYATSKKMDKKTITAEIVTNIHNSGGRFLKRDYCPKHKNIDWEEVDFETARLKVSHSFRTTTKSQTNQEQHEGNGEEDFGLSEESLNLIMPEDFMSFDAVTTEPIPSNSDVIDSIHSTSSETPNKRRKG